MGEHTFIYRGITLTTTDEAVENARSKGIDLLSEMFKSVDHFVDDIIPESRSPFDIAEQYAKKDDE